MKHFTEVYHLISEIFDIAMSEFHITMSNLSHCQVINMTLLCHNDIIALTDVDNPFLGLYLVARFTKASAFLLLTSVEIISLSV